MLKCLYRKKYLKILSVACLFSLFFSVASCDTIKDINNIVLKKPYFLTTSPTDYQNKMFNSFSSFDNSRPSLEKLIDYFCFSVLFNGGLYDWLLYSPDKSSFLYLLCTNINSTYVDYFKKNNENYTTYFKTTDFDKLWLSVSKKNKALAYLYVHDIFNNVVNEYFNIKQAHIYGLETAKDDKKSIEAQANEFSSWYFLWMQICSNDNPTYSYKKTCNYLKQYMRSVKPMVNWLNILSIDKMYEDYSLKSDLKKNPKFCDVSDYTGYNTILCWLWWKPGEKDLNGFVNLVYNELYYYNLFVQYYGYRLDKEATSLGGSTSSVDIRTAYSEQKKKIKIMTANLEWSQTALGIGIRMLTDAYVTFPLHIGMLMYWENLTKFGKEIAKIYTPVYTLYDKLRNVQCQRP